MLCVAAGKAKLCLGGEDNPERVELMVQTGDVMIVPAGVSHQLLDDVEGEFSMVGSYLKGKDWDMCYVREGEEARVENNGRLGWFEKDPTYGDEGPMLQVRWVVDRQRRCSDKEPMTKSVSKPRGTVEIWRRKQEYAVRIDRQVKR